MIAVDTITVRPLEQRDRAALVDLLLELYPGLRADPAFAARFYGWKYFDLDGRDTGYPAAFVADNEGALVGLIGCLPFRLRQDGQTCVAGWIADWRLLERARGRGLGSALLQAATDCLPALACVNGSASAERIYAERGFRSWECARSWRLVVRPLAFEWPCRTGWRRPLGLPRALQHRLARRTLATPPVELAPAVPIAAAETLLAGNTADGMVRDGAYLGWLARCPAAALRLYPLLHAGQTLGYALLHADRDALGRRRGRVLDLWIESADKELIAGAYAACARQLADADYIQLTAPVAHDQGLRRAGFDARRNDRLWLRSSVFGLGPSAEWHVSLVDKDDAFRGAGIIP